MSDELVHLTTVRIDVNGTWRNLALGHDLRPTDTLADSVCGTAWAAPASRWPATRAPAAPAPSSWTVGPCSPA